MNLLPLIKLPLFSFVPTARGFSYLTVVGIFLFVLILGAACRKKEGSSRQSTRASALLRSLKAPTSSPVSRPRIDYVRGVQVRTLAGSGEKGYANGPAAQARFCFPTGVLVAPQGRVWIADKENTVLRLLRADGRVTLGAGGSCEDLPCDKDGHPLEAIFNIPRRLAWLGPQRIAIADTDAIRLLKPGEDVSTLAGRVAAGGFRNGPGATARLSYPHGLVASAKGSILYIADLGNHAIRILSQGRLSTLAGHPQRPGWQDGPLAQARLRKPAGLALSAKNSILYIADLGNHAIRILSQGQLSTLAGHPQRRGLQDGPLAQARFSHPIQLALSRDNRFLFVVDQGNHAIRRIDLQRRLVQTLAGGQKAGFGDGPGKKARFLAPTDLALRTGRLLVADSGNHRLRLLTLPPPSSQKTTTFFSHPGALHPLFVMNSTVLTPLSERFESLAGILYNEILSCVESR